MVRTIEIEVEDSALETALFLIKNWKDGIAKSFKIQENVIRGNDFYQTKAYFQNAYSEIKEGKTKLVPFNDGLDELDDYIDSIK